MERWFLPSIFFMLKNSLHCLQLATHHGGNERRNPRQSLRCPTQYTSHLSSQCRFIPRQSSLPTLLAKVAAVLCGESRSQRADFRHRVARFLLGAGEEETGGLAGISAAGEEAGQSGAQDEKAQKAALCKKAKLVNDLSGFGPQKGRGHGITENNTVRGIQNRTGASRSRNPLRLERLGERIESRSQGEGVMGCNAGKVDGGGDSKEGKRPDGGQESP
jgi:hypothetical protein